MNNQPVLSICIPTNGSVRWLIPLLDSIYIQEADKSLFEVVVTDNGKDSEVPNYLSRYQYDNFRYIPTKEEGFLNLVASLEYGQGMFCKMINHRCKMVPGAITKMIELVQKYLNEKPVIYCTNNFIKGSVISEYDNLNDFTYKMGVWCSWSAGIGVWKDDVVAISKIQLNDMFPNASILFDSKINSRYVIWNDTYVTMDDDPTKGGYDFFYVFGVEYLNIINELRVSKRISDGTFVHIKKELFTFLTDSYIREVMLPSRHNYDKSDVKSCLKIYYGSIYYWVMLFYALMRMPRKVFRKLTGK